MLGSVFSLHAREYVGEFPVTLAHRATQGEIATYNELANLILNELGVGGQVAITLEEAQSEAGIPRLLGRMDTGEGTTEPEAVGAFCTVAAYCALYRALHEDVPIWSGDVKPPYDGVDIPHDGIDRELVVFLYENVAGRFSPHGYRCGTVDIAGCGYTALFKPDEEIPFMLKDGNGIYVRLYRKGSEAGYLGLAFPQEVDETGHPRPVNESGFDIAYYLSCDLLELRFSPDLVINIGILSEPHPLPPVQPGNAPVDVEIAPVNPGL